MREISRRTLASSSFSSRRCFTRSPILTQPPVVVKKRNSAQIDDGEPVRHDCDMASENRANLDVSNGSAERKSATPPPKSETGIPASPPSPLPLPWGALRVEPVAVIVFAPPGQCFQVRSGYGAPAYDSL